MGPQRTPTRHRNHKILEPSDAKLVQRLVERVGIPPVLVPGNFVAVIIFFNADGGNFLVECRYPGANSAHDCYYLRD